MTDKIFSKIQIRNYENKIPPFGHQNHKKKFNYSQTLILAKGKNLSPN